MVLNKLKILFFQHAMTVDRSPQLGHFTQQNEANAPDSAGFEKEKTAIRRWGRVRRCGGKPHGIVIVGSGEADVQSGFDPGLF